MEEGPDSVSDRVRAACASVAAEARSVRVDESAIATYAADLPAATELPAADPATHFGEGDREGRAAFVICLNAINFGSGWWPQIRKRPGHSGYFTIAAGLTERFRVHGPWPAGELSLLGPTDLAVVTGQDPALPLMEQYAAALRDVGERLLAHYGGQPVPFYKRAQIAAADINRTGVAALREEDRLTAFADNLVPHVLRIDGVLRLDPELEARVEAGELLVHDSAEEVELRACAVHAVELLSAAGRLCPAEIDGILWNRGAGERYKSSPRPRSRNTAY